MEDDRSFKTPEKGYVSRLTVGTRVFVDHGTKPGVSGKKCNPYFAIITAVLDGEEGGYKVREENLCRAREKGVPEYAVSASTSWAPTDCRKGR